MTDWTPQASNWAYVIVCVSCLYANMCGGGRHEVSHKVILFSTTDNHLERSKRDELSVISSHFVLPTLLRSAHFVHLPPHFVS